MDRDTALLGRWSSHPFEYGVMEASELELHEDGRGTGTVLNALGDDVTRFRWHCPEPGVLELRTEYGETERLPYTVAPAAPPLSPDPVPAVTFEGLLFLTNQYARLLYDMP